MTFFPLLGGAGGPAVTGPLVHLPAELDEPQVLLVAWPGLRGGGGPGPVVGQLGMKTDYAVAVAVEVVSIDRLL